MLPDQPGRQAGRNGISRMRVKRKGAGRLLRPARRAPSGVAGSCRQCRVKHCQPGERSGASRRSGAAWRRRPGPAAGAPGGSAAASRHRRPPRPGRLGQRLAAAKSRGIERRVQQHARPHAAPLGQLPEMRARGPCRHTRRTAAARCARRAGRPAGRRRPRPAGSAAGPSPSASAKNGERNGSTREPSELVPSGNRIRLSPAASRAACRRARARWRCACG